MNNKDTILKYFSDLMTEEEKAEFENNLNSDLELKKEFDEIKNSLNSISEKSEVELNTVYFNNLIPRVREKIEQPKKSKIAFLAPAFSIAIVATVVFLLNFPTIDNYIEQNGIFSITEMEKFISLADSSELDSMLQNNFFENYTFYQNDEFADYVIVYPDESIYLDENINYGNEFYNTSYEINGLSEEDIEVIYEELINKKIL